MKPSGEQLRLVLDREVLLFHFDEILTAELPVVTDAANFEALRAPRRVPLDHVVVVEHLVVAHIEPAVVLPAEERDLVLLRLLRRSDDREPAVRDDDVHTLVVPEQARRGQIVQL